MSRANSTARFVRLSATELEGRDVPALFAVTLRSPAAGDTGDSAAVHAGGLQVNPSLPAHAGGGRVVEAATQADAVRAALVGSVTAAVGGRSVGYAFGPGAAGGSKADRLPYLVEVSGATGRVWLEPISQPLWP